MTIELIAKIGMGTATIPESEPEEPVVVVVPLEPHISPPYEVSLLLPAELPAEDVEVTDQTATEVTLTVTRPEGYAGSPGLTVHVLCIVRNDELDSGWVDATPYLDAGWTATLAQLRQVGPVTYFLFDLTAAASIDGTPKTDTVRVLDLSSGPEFSPSQGGIYGLCLTDSDQLMKFRGAAFGDVSTEGAVGTTGNWSDGTTFLFGQVSWIAGT